MKMKIQTIAIVAGAAAAVGFPQTAPLNGKTTEDLESSTKQFIEVFESKPKKSNENNKKLNAGKRKLHPHEGETRSERLNAKNGKSSFESGSTSKSDKSDKSGTGTRSSGQDDETQVFSILPVGCPYQCVGANTNLRDELEESVSRCDSTDDAQRWIVHADGAYVKVESILHQGKCISVDYIDGDESADVEGACSDGVLALKECSEIFGTKWYFTGGQLVSAFCWAFGLSSLMSVFLQEEVGLENCDAGLFVFGERGTDPILRADTFMFVDTLPEFPFQIEPAVPGPTFSPTEV